MTTGTEGTVFDPNTGNEDPEVRAQWRANRAAAYRLAYKEEHGKNHPADKAQPFKGQTKHVADNVTPPKGMTFRDFGTLWDFHQDQPDTPVLRKRSVADEWAEIAEANATPLTDATD